MPRRFDRYDAALYVVALIALAARLYDLDGPSVWLDETATRREMASLSSILSRVSFPPLYYLLLRAWAAVFGDDWATLRALSAVAGSISVVVLGRAVRELFGSRGLMVATALVFAWMPEPLRFARQMRMYALWVLFLLVAMWGAIGATRSARPARTPFVRYWLGLAAAAATHHYTVVYAPAVAAGSFLLAGKHWLRKEPEDWRRLLLLHGPVVLLGALQIVAVLLLSGYGPGELLAKVGRDLYSHPGFDPWRKLATIVVPGSWGRSGASWSVALLFVSLAGTAVLSCVTRTGRRGVAFLAIAGIVPVIVLACLPTRSYPRLLSPAVPCVVAILTFGGWLLWRERRTRWLLLPVTAAWLLALGPKTLGYHRAEPESWNSVCAVVSAPEPGAGILLTAPYMRPPFDVCYRGPHPVRTFPPRRKAFDPEWVRDFVRDKQVVWVIYARAGRSDPQKRAIQVLAAEGFQVERTAPYGRVIWMYRFARRPVPPARPETGQRQNHP